MRLGRESGKRSLKNCRTSGLTSENLQPGNLLFNIEPIASGSRPDFTLLVTVTVTGSSRRHNKKGGKAFIIGESITPELIGREAMYQALDLADERQAISSPVQRVVELHSEYPL
jgi:hypothetical protein